MHLFKLLLLGCTVLGAPTKDEGPLPPPSEVWPNLYSVYLKWDSKQSAAEHAGWATSLHERDHGGHSGVQNVFTLNELKMKGYTGEFTDDVINKIREDREVEQVIAEVKPRRTKTRIEPDTEPNDRGQQNPKLESSRSWFWNKPSNPRLKINHDIHTTRQSEEVLEQTNAPWGLSRISESEFPRFRYPASAGAGTYIYVLDTGVDLNHEDFEGRAEFGFDATLALLGPEVNVTEQDQLHGTHVASTAAGARWGVAKNARIVDVKVLRAPVDPGYKDHDNVQKSGIDWAVWDIRQRNLVGKAVLNLSWGRFQDGAKDSGCDSLALSINKAVDIGIPVVIAAGNEDISASHSCPANIWRAITVGAIDENNQRLHQPDFDGPGDLYELNSSNWGQVVDIFAPGARIRAAEAGTMNGSALMTGTSLAAPHVAGVIATWLGQQKKAKSVLDVENKILFDLSQKGVVGDTKGSKNRLLYNGY